jgi:hypothetical protein
VSKKNRTGPVCHRAERKEERLRFYTDINGIARQRCPSCGDDRAIPRRPAPALYTSKPWERTR